MKFITDENVDKQLVSSLRALGYDVLSVTEAFPTVQDDVILEYASKEHRIVITSDKDFGELVYRNGLVHEGIILLRLGDIGRDLTIQLVTDFIQANSQQLINKYCVIAPGNVRLRPLLKTLP